MDWIFLFTPVRGDFPNHYVSCCLSEPFASELLEIMIAFRCYGCVHTGTLSIRIYLTNIHIVFLFVCCPRLKQTDSAGHHPVIPPSQRRCEPNWAGGGFGSNLYIYILYTLYALRPFVHDDVANIFAKTFKQHKNICDLCGPYVWLRSSRSKIGK